MSKKANIPSPGVLTKEEVVAKFSAIGLSFAEFARREKFDLPLVYSVLHGRGKGLRGQSHNIAVALGMKVGIRTDRKSPRSASAKRSVQVVHGQGVSA